MMENRQVDQTKLKARCPKCTTVQAVKYVNKPKYGSARFRLPRHQKFTPTHIHGARCHGSGKTVREQVVQ